MKKKGIVLSVLSIVSLLLFLSINLLNEEEFDFSLSYSVDGKEFISTFDNKLVVDTVEGLKELDFKLNKKDMKKIKKKIIELEIMDVDFSNLPISDFDSSFGGKYDLKIEKNGEVKKVYWTTKNNSPITLISKIENKYEGEYGRVNRLFDLKTFILKIIIQYEEYQQLPAHRLYM